nr:hypothetical protein GCM10020185_36540 [Pseudomonas brassicacearum subsp. brassicacearum]
MSDFTFWDVVRNLLTGLQWTLALSLVAFIGGGVIGLLIMVLRISKSALPRNIARTYIELFQGTPLLMQLFLVFFGVALAGVEISPWMAAAIALTLFTSAYLAEIWRGCVDSISHGQWEASASLALNPLEQLRYVILPQALRIAVAPTVGFFGASGQGHGRDLDHWLYRTDQDRRHARQRHVRAVHGLWPGRPRLFPALLPLVPQCALPGKETACLCLELPPCINTTAIITCSKAST